jgi:hypothetical protein
MRWKNTGIFETYFPETLAELFHHSDYGGNPNFLAEIARCATRARQILEDLPSQSRKIVIVNLDDSRRPIKDDHRKTLEAALQRDLRKDRRVIEDPALLGTLIDARDLLLAEDVFHRTLQLFERSESIEDAKRCLGILIPLAMQIDALDKRICVRPFEPDTLAGREQRKGREKGRDKLDRNQKETKREFLKLFKVLKKNARHTKKSKRQLIEDTRESFRKWELERPKDDRVKTPMKTPSRSSAYGWFIKSSRET